MEDTYIQMTKLSVEAPGFCVVGGETTFLPHSDACALEGYYTGGRLLRLAGGWTNVRRALELMCRR